MTGAGALALGGCSAARQVVVRVPPKPDPDQVLRHQVAAEIRPVLTAYDEVIAVTAGDPKALLITLRAQVAAHVLALAGPAPTASPSPTPSTAAATSPPPSASTAPSATSIGDLIRLERGAATRRLTQVHDAGPALARLLASIAASNATHVALLREESS